MSAGHQSGKINFDDFCKIMDDDSILSKKELNL